MAPQTDENLMSRFKQGDNAAFAELYNRYRDRLYTFFVRMLGFDREKASDFTQELFLKIIGKKRQYDETRKFAAWIYAVAANLCKNEYRGSAARSFQDIDSTVIPDSAPGQAEAVHRQMLYGLAVSALDDFDPREKTAFLLKYQEEFSLSEISEILECPVNTAKTLLFRTTKKLAEKFKTGGVYEK
jgi:RNA polymerase sigma-70 factor (ECF subfamily)